MTKSGVEHLAQHPGWKTRNAHKKRVIVVIHQGVAEVITADVPVDIVDIDNLEETTAEEFRPESLSREAKDYLLLDWPELAASLGIVAEEDTI